MSAAGVPYPKRLKPPPSSVTIDRFSALPKALIVHILSFLPTLRDKIRTGALGRRWQYLWTYVPKLYFNDRECIYFKHSEDFVNVVNDTLILCAGWKVKYFGVRMKYEDVFSSDIDRWTRFVARNKIQNFEIGFYRLYGRETEHYVFLQHLYSNSTFRKLGRSYCCLVITQPVSWKSLKRISLLGCEFDTEELEMILEDTPALESSDLFLIRGIYNLRFGIWGLTKLAVIMDQWDSMMQT